MTRILPVQTTNLNDDQPVIEPPRIPARLVKLNSEHQRLSFGALGRLFARV